MLFDEIVNLLVDEIETINQDAFIIPNNGGYWQKENTKIW